VAERLLVAFAGEGSGVGELTWGQQTVWRGIESRGTPIILTGVAPLPEGTTTADVADDVGFLMSRHQSLRTRLQFSDDGRIRQVVAGSGELRLEIVDADDDAGPRKAADALATEYEKAERDYANDWPIRTAVIRHKGVPAYWVVATCHIVTDGFGAKALFADLRARDPATGKASRPVTAIQPLEQARWQGSPAGRRQSEAAQRYWGRLLRTIPPRRFAESHDKRQPRYWEVIYNSPAAYLAIKAIAARRELDTTPVLLAAFAVAMTRVTGISPVVLRVMVSNRFRPRFADSVSPVSQTCPCVIDVVGITVDEAVTRAWRASVGAYKHAYFEPVKIRELLAAVSTERGEEIDLNCVFNDRRMATPRGVEGPPPGPEEVRAALPCTTLKWEDQTDDPTDECHIHVYDSPDSVNVMVQFDTHYVSPDDVEAILRGMEAVSLKAAFDPDAPTGV
jgi:hypothetical protein